MTIPVVRQRAHAPKTRTGCKTCRARHLKCDEQKPTCARCNKSGRACLGYDRVRSPNEDAPRTALQPKPAQPCRSILRHAPRIHLDLTIAERQSLDYFRLSTVQQLPGNPWLLSWEHLTMHANYQEPPILHAAVALGALHRAQGASLVGVDQKLYDFAVDQCNRAMVYASKHIDNLTPESPDSAIEVVMVLSLLLFCFEVWCGQDTRASFHLRTGLSILYDRVQRRDGPGLQDQGRRVRVRVDPKDNLDILLQTFIRLDYDLTIQGKPDTRLVPVVSASMPECFSSLENGLVYLDSLAASVLTATNALHELARSELRDEMPDFECFDQDELGCLIGVRSRHMSLVAHPEMASRLKACKDDIAQWMRAFACIPFTSARELPHLLAQIQAFTLWHEVSYWREIDEMLEDRFQAQFEYILGLAERYVDMQTSSLTAKPNISLGTPLVHCIFGIAAKCRTSSIRRRCIALIRSISLEGVFDSHCIAAFAETVVGLEESYARRILRLSEGSDLEAGQVPRVARLLDVNLIDWETPGFYKGSHGRMVYAYYSSAGNIRVDHQSFAIARP